LYRAISLDKDLQDKEIKTKDLVICRQQWTMQKMIRSIVESIRYHKALIYL
jgi:hypothetical protein